jgi:anaerobic magnesium-protoporphyrin IX monomethyl ester cyclase
LFIIHNSGYRHIKAVVITPPIQDFYNSPQRLSSLGAHIVVQLLQRDSIETRFIDGMSLDAGAFQIPLPDALSYLSPYIIHNETGKCSFFRHYYHIGNSFEKIATTVINFNPQLCFIACFAYCYSATAIELSRILKESLPGVTIIAGGAGVSVHPDHFLRNQSIDYTLSGEAEIILPPFVDFIKRGCTNPDNVPSLGWKTDGHLFHSSAGKCTTASILQPVIVKTTVNKRSTTFTASLSRGCLSRCSFCANHLTHGNIFRHCFLDQFEKVLNNCMPPSDNAVAHFNFEDDNLLCDMPFFRSAIAACRSRFTNINFTAENGLDYRLLTPETCTELIDAGFRQFNFTLGSVSPKVLERTDRSIGLELYDRLLFCTSHHSLPVVTYIICGLPADTKVSIAANLRFLQSRATIIGISLFYPVPGLSGFENFSLFDTLPSQLCCGSSAYPWNNSLSTETLVTAFRLARFINLMKNTAKTDEDNELINKILQTRSLHTIIKDKRQRKIIRVSCQDEELVKMVLK